MKYYEKNAFHSIRKVFPYLKLEIIDSEVA